MTEHIAKTTGKPDKRMTKKRPGYTPNGRPEKPIDWDKVDDLLRAGCTGSEVAAYFDMYPQTLCDRVTKKYGCSFTVYSQQRKQHGESILRAHQYAKALGLTKEGDNTLLIWLGKQRLNQRETPEQDEIPDTILKSFDALLKQIDEMQSH